MRTIAIVNQKGGCGKTTISINLANAMAELGQKTLLVDMDPQSHCAVGLAVPEDQIEQSIYDVLISKSRNEPIKLTEILWQISDKLELAPASIDLSAFEQQMSGISERECCLKKTISEVSNDFDFAIIDCPPAVSLLTFNALRAADEVVVPVETGYFSLHGLSKQLETLSILCQRCDQQITVRVLASMYDIRTKMAREILSELRSHFSDKMFKTTINFNTKLKEAASFGQPIGEYDPASKGEMDFRTLAEELIGSEAKQQRREIINSLNIQLEAISSTAEELLQAAKPIATPTPPQPVKVEEPEPADEELPQTIQPIATPPQPVKIEEPVPVAKELLQTAEPITTLPEPVNIEEPEPVAEELLQTPEPIAKIPEPVKAEEPTLLGTDVKLSDYYGVNQLDDAIVFVTLYPRAESVQIAADFNNWQPEKTPMEKVGTSGIWQTKLKLPAGKHRYRLVVDGQWQQDPYNKSNELNPFGEYNSIVVVQ